MILFITSCYIGSVGNWNMLPTILNIYHKTTSLFPLLCHLDQIYLR